MPGHKWRCELDDAPDTSRAKVIVQNKQIQRRIISESAAARVNDIALALLLWRKHRAEPGEIIDAGMVGAES